MLIAWHVVVEQKGRGSSEAWMRMAGGTGQEPQTPDPETMILGKV